MFPFFIQLRMSQQLSTQKLAEAGLILTWPGNTAKCYTFRIEINNLQAKDNLIVEHLKQSPECPFILALSSEDITDKHIVNLLVDDYKDIYKKCNFANNRKILHQLKSSSSRLDKKELIPKEYTDVRTISPRPRKPEYADIYARLRSFSSWLSSHPVRPVELVEAGFYYTGKDDRVECFSCGGKLMDWHRGDIPFFEHYKLFGECPYVKRCKSHPVVAAILTTAKQMADSQINVYHRHECRTGGYTQCDRANKKDN